MFHLRGFRMADDNTLILAHGDIDGMVAAAICWRQETSATKEARFTSARIVVDHLREASYNPPAALYVVDIPAKPDVLPVLGALVGVGCRVHWIDHHPWPPALERQMSDLGVVVTYKHAFNKPAGVLAAEKHGDADPDARRIGDICYAGPTIDRGETLEPWTEKWFWLLSGLVGRASQEYIGALAALCDPLTIPGSAESIEVQKKLTEGLRRDLAERHFPVKDLSGIKTVLLDLQSYGNAYSGQVFRAYPECHISVSYRDLRKFQLSLNRRYSLSFESLVGSGRQHYDPGRRLMVGGRPNLVAASFSTADVENVDLILGWIVELRRDGPWKGPL